MGQFEQTSLAPFMNDEDVEKRRDTQGTVFFWWKMLKYNGF